MNHCSFFMDKSKQMEKLGNSNRLVIDNIPLVEYNERIG